MPLTPWISRDIFPKSSSFRGWDRVDDLEAWEGHVRMRIMAASHFNRENKKCLEHLKHAKQISDPPDHKVALGGT